MKRREFLAGLSIAGVAPLNTIAAAAGKSDETKPEYYEMRQYHLLARQERKIFDDFFRDAAIPAMNRIGTGPVGVFNAMYGADSSTIYVLLPHRSLESLAGAYSRLAADADYQKAGVPTENGNEWVYRFAISWEVKVTLFGEIIINTVIPIQWYDRSASFCTPLGHYEFPLPVMGLELFFNFFVVGVGVGIGGQAYLASTEFTAEWQVEGDASTAGGEITYNKGVEVPFGPVIANDFDTEQDYVQIRLSQFRYHLHPNSRIEVGPYFIVSILGIKKYWLYPLFISHESIDYYGTHSGTLDSFTKLIYVENVPPAVIIDKSGAIAINGSTVINNSHLQSYIKTELALHILPQKRPPKQ